MTSKFFICSGLMAAFVGTGYTQSGPYNFDNDAVDNPPAGFTSYASGGGSAGKWLVKEMSDAPSGKHVLEQTDADRTNTRFPILIAEKGEYTDLDVSVKGKALSGKKDQGIGLVFRFRDPKTQSPGIKTPPPQW